MNDVNIEELLVSWGHWSRQDVLPDAPRCAIPFLSKPDADDPAWFGQTLLERVDAAMLALKVRHDKIYRVLAARYLYGNYDDRNVGRRLGVSEQTIRVWRNQGHMFIDGRLAEPFSVKRKTISCPASEKQV